MRKDALPENSVMGLPFPRVRLRARTIGTSRLTRHHNQDPNEAGTTVDFGTAGFVYNHQIQTPYRFCRVAPSSPQASPLRKLCSSRHQHGVVEIQDN
jgi:hypothetical protein